jgi:hypothetical protein
MKPSPNSNYMVSNQKPIYAQPPSGRFNSIAGNLLPKKGYLPKQGNANNLHDQSEGGDSMNQAERDSGVDNLLSEPLYRQMSDTDNIYSEQSIPTEGPMDTLFM